MNVRLQAAQAILEIHRTRATAKEIWDGARPAAETALVLGVLRRRGTLDAILKAYSSRKLPLLKPELLACLRTGLFEILYFDDTPAHAAVHSAVENLRAMGRPQDTGFLNAVLRSVQRGFRLVPAQEATDPRRTLPRDGHALLFKKSVFPDRTHDPAGFLAARGSAPRWLAERRLAELGLDRALTCLELQASTPSTHLRVRASVREEVESTLTGLGIPFSDGPHSILLTLPPKVRIGDVLEACGDKVTVQDAVASQVAPYLAPQKGARILDFCAAPGGKATHLAELVGPEGNVVACDVKEDRLALVAENAARLGLENIEGVLLPAELPADFDGVLVDAPCSNTGVLARRPEARWRVRRKDLTGLTQRQLKILKEAASRVKPGGIVVYSTCSLEEEENLGVVRALLEKGGFELLDARTIWPDDGAGGGGFMARIRRL